MVVVEQEENDESQTTADSVNTITPDVNGNDSDQYETASERDVSDSEEEKKNDQATTASEDHKQKESSNEGGGSNSNDDETKERALSKANEAKLEGNKMFGEGNYEEALLKYAFALQVAPQEDMPSSVELRSICHSNRGVCFLKLGKYEDTIKECSKALELNPSYIKALVRRGEAREKLENFEEAIADMKKILELDPSNDQAKKAIRRLEPLAAEKREKMKEEMIGKLKEMGNSVLGRFGMSIDNFKAVKDPNTGSYSISFQR